MSPTDSEDTVTLEKLAIPLPKGLGLSAFSLSLQPCTILLTVVCHLLPGCISASAVADDLPGERSVNYSSLGKRLYREISEGQWLGFSELADAVEQIIAEEHGEALGRIDITIDRPRALLFAGSVSLNRTIASNDQLWTKSSGKLTLHHLRTRAIIGLNPHERLEEQDLDVDIEVQVVDGWSDFDYKGLGNSALSFLTASSYQTLEALSLALVQHCIERIAHSPDNSTTLSANTDVLASNSLTQPLTGTHTLAREACAAEYPGAVEVRVRKPSAMAFAEYPMLTVKRRMADFAEVRESNLFQKEMRDAPVDGSKDAAPAERAQPASRAGAASGQGKKAIIAIGTNLGDRISNIQKALLYLCSVTSDGGEVAEGKPLVTLRRTSRMYESQPMYVEDQGRFINAVFEIHTSLDPTGLLRLLKRTESHLGRVKTIRNGPRIIDLDLIMFGADEVINIGSKGDAEGTIGPGCGWLEVPHWGIAEREFVIEPLLDILPSDYRHPSLKASLGDLMKALPRDRIASLLPIIPFMEPSPPLTLVSGRPRIMGILNCTPDSFSDGAAERVDESALDKVLSIAKRLIADGADILDIGGMSTRPGVKDTDVSEDEELGRIIPVIQALRLDGVDVPISVDTFRASVAEQAILAGASCINDVRGGREEGMLETMARLDVPIILMHSRGTSVTMISDEAKDYSACGGVVPGVMAEMAEMVAAAERAGVKRWNIAIDPGIGFAKSLGGNLELLRGLKGVLAPKDGTQRYSTLVGASRKGFIGTITDRKDPKDREFGTAAISALCCASGAVDIVRVHEPGPSKDVIAMLSAVAEAGSDA